MTLASRRLAPSDSVPGWRTHPGWLSVCLDRPVAALLLLALWLVAALGLRPLLLPDEGRYAEVARAMLAAGDWLVPRLDGLPFFHKPPLFYWLDVVAMRVLGDSAFAARVGAMLGAWLMGASLFLALRHWRGPRAAAVGLIALATNPLFFLSAQYANHDMLVAGLISAAVWAFVRALEPGRWSKAWLAGGWLACACAVLAKGLIGAVLPALILGPWLAAHGRWRLIPRLLHPLGLLVFAAVALPWFVAVQLRYPGFFDYFIMEQHFRRFAQSTFNNVQPFWFFVGVLPLTTLPWSAWIVSALRKAWHAHDEAATLCAWWVVAVVGFFSLPSSKLVGYVLPALAPWCALLALALGRLDDRALRRLGCASAVVCLAIVGGLAWRAPTSNKDVALALAARMQPRDRVVMVDAYFYDVPFYARLAQPVVIASDWNDPALPLRDNWRKELWDAARFDPVRAATLLRPIGALGSLSCGAGDTWLLTKTVAAEASVASLKGAQRVSVVRDVALWRMAAHPCPRTG